VTLSTTQYPRFRPYQRGNVTSAPFWDRLSKGVQEAINVVSAVLPFRTNEYVTGQLIDWDNVPEDPIFQLTFPQRGMLADEDYNKIAALIASGADKKVVEEAAMEIRLRLNPHPAGQTDNLPMLNGERLEGIQHKYRETVLFFPAQGQTCHAYCSFCFRWPQFVGSKELRFENREASQLVAYLEQRPDVTDVILTGGDPMIMRTQVLREYIEPLLKADLPNLRTLRIGTKALSFWPGRFVTDDDADDLMKLFEEVTSSGLHLAIMAHICHPTELKTDIAKEAVERIRNTGGTLFTQSPLVRHVNDKADAWAELWDDAVRMGITPYYMFVERDTGASRYFEIPLVETWEIHQAAALQVSGLARTVRGPVMSANLGKVEILGPIERDSSEPALALQFLQARDAGRVYQPFKAKLDPKATWFEQLAPFGPADEKFFSPDAF
jgi:KamA family protein